MASQRAGQFERRDIGVAAFCFAATVLLRLPFRSEFAYHWDGVEFALAAREYSVALSQPHAPGYFLYVMLGKLLDVFVGDAHASFVWLSVLAGGALTAVLYLLGAAMFGHRAGLVAAAFGATSPQAWFHSEVALTYIVDSSLICVTVLWCWCAIRRGGTWRDAAGIGAMLALLGGVRQQTVPALLPLIGLTFWRFEGRRLAKLLLAGVVTLVLFALWFAPMVAMSGGLTQYMEAVRRHVAFNAPASFAGGGLDAMLWNVFFAALYCWGGLFLIVPLLVGAVLYRLRQPERKRAWDQQHALALQVLATWLGPMMLFSVALSFVKQPGYVLSFLPVFLLLAAAAAASLRRRTAIALVTASVCAVNVFVFLAWPKAWDPALFRTTPTARKIRERDAQLRDTFALLRAQLDPADTVVCHAHEFLFFGLRHFQLYTPEFRHLQLAADPTMITPPGRPLMATWSGRLHFVGGLDELNVRRVVLLVPPTLELSTFAPVADVSQARLLAESAARLYEIPASAVKAP